MAAFVKSSAVTVGTATINLASVTAGNMVVACVSAWVSGVATVSDATNGAWTQLASAPRVTSGTVGNVTLLYRANSAAGTLNITVVPGGGDYVWQVAEFSGMATASVVDGTPTTGGANGTAVSTGNYTSTNAADVLFAAMGVAVPQGSITENAGAEGFTQIGEYLTAAGGENVLDWGYKIVASTGTYVETWTLASGGDWYAAIAGVKTAATGTTMPATGSSYALTGTDAILQQSSPLTWLRVGR